MIRRVKALNLFEYTCVRRWLRLQEKPTNFLPRKTAGPLENRHSTTPKTPPPNAASVPWSSPTNEDTDDFDEIIDDDYPEADDGDPYVVKDYEDDDTGAIHYPESHNGNMPPLKTKEYVQGAVEISEDKDGDYRRNMLAKVQRGRFEDEGSEDGDQDHTDDDDNYWVDI